MKLRHAKIVVALMLVGLLSACEAHATNTPAPASQPTERPAPPTQAIETIPAATKTAQPTTVPNTEPAAQASPVSFANDVLPLLESRCKNCHGGNRTEEGLVLLTYADIMKGSKNGPVVSPGNADSSLLVELLVEQKMPKRGPKLTSPQVQLIIDWINQGAMEN